MCRVRRICERSSASARTRPSASALDVAASAPCVVRTGNARATATTAAAPNLRTTTPWYFTRARLTYGFTSAAWRGDGWGPDVGPTDSAYRRHGAARRAASGGDRA